MTSAKYFTQWVWVSVGGTRCIWEPDNKGHGTLTMFRGGTGCTVPNCNTLDEACERVLEYTGEIPEAWTVEDWTVEDLR